MKAEVCEKGFDTKKNSFVQYYGSDQLDSSLLMLARVGFLPPTDPRIIGTVDAIQRELMVDGFVQRYQTSDEDAVDGLPAGEGTFLLTTFWLVDNLALIGREDEARALFERLRGLQNDVGMLSEEYDAETKRLIGNFPQAFSHLGLIVSASHLSAAHPSPLSDPRDHGGMTDEQRALRRHCVRHRSAVRRTRRSPPMTGLTGLTALPASEPQERTP